MSETSHSLLERLKRQSDPDSWERLVDVYTPLFHSWLRRYAVLSLSDVDDLTQEVLLAVYQEMPIFHHNQRRGAFRSWLRTILVHRLRKFWNARNDRPIAFGGSDFPKQLDELEDQSSRISEVWDREHDRHVLGRLLAAIKPRFADKTWTAFQNLVLCGDSAEKVSADLQVSLNVVYTAKSRVIKELRAEADGLIS